MLKITQTQLDTITEIFDIDFCDKYVRYIRSNHSELVERLRDEELRKIIMDSLSAARSTPLTSSEAITLFVDLLILAGGDVAFRTYLTESICALSLTEEGNIDYLLEQISLRLEKINLADKQG